MNLILERRHSIWTMFETTEIKESIIMCVIKRNLIFGQHLKVKCYLSHCENTVEWILNICPFDEYTFSFLFYFIRLSRRSAPIFFFNCEHFLFLYTVKQKQKKIRGFYKFNENRILLESYF